ncbi:MAG: hypothetical protein IH619_05625 [Ignavibacterium sp.]|nr:hypothetical protein [Ignavibacterium sp.]
MNENHLDINHYDVHSRHFALNCGGLTVGYFRVVLPKDELTNTEVLEIGKKYKLLDEEDYFHKNGKAPFPFLSYEGVPQSHWDYFNEIQSRNEMVAESSRLMLHTEHRSIRKSKLLCECAMMLYPLIFISKKNVLISVRKEHAPCYIRQGFVPIANGETYYIKETDIVGITLTIPLSQTLSDSTIPARLHQNINQMAEEFKTTGKIEREI